MSTNIETQALNLLGQGYSQEVTANALGVDATRISQLMQNSEFRTAVMAARANKMQQVSEIDKVYDTVENVLAKKLESMVKTLYKPSDILKATAVVNALKRRAPASALTENSGNSNQVINLVMPGAVMAKFVSNINNQIVEVQDVSGRTQQLLTIQAGKLQQLASEIKEKTNGCKVIEHTAPKEQPKSPDTEALPKRLAKITGNETTFITTDSGQVIKLVDCI